MNFMKNFDADHVEGRLKLLQSIRDNMVKCTDTGGPTFPKHTAWEVDRIIMEHKHGYTSWPSHLKRLARDIEKWLDSMRGIVEAMAHAEDALEDIERLQLYANKLKLGGWIDG